MFCLIKFLNGVFYFLQYAQQVLHSKFNVQLSLLSFELLNAFLRDEQLFLLFSILNERVNLIVTTNQPGLQVRNIPFGPEIENADLRHDALGSRV